MLVTTLNITFFTSYLTFHMCNMSNSEICTRWNAGMKQVIFETKIDFTKSLDNLKPHINDNFNNINDQLVTIKSGFFLKKIV